MLALDSYNAYGPDLYKTCTCGPMQSTLSILNTGDTVNQVQVSAVGEKGSWVTFAPEVAIVLPHETATITQFVNPSCDAPGLYDFGVEFSGNGDQIKILRQQISVAQCAAPAQQNATQVAPSDLPDVDTDLILTILTWASIIFTIFLVMLLVILIVMAMLSGEKKPKKEKVRVEEAQPIAIKRPLRYPWEAYFKRKAKSIKVEEPKKVVSAEKEPSVWRILAMILAIIVVIIILIFAVWFLSQPTTIVLGQNGSNTTMVLNVSKLTSI